MKKERKKKPQDLAQLVQASDQEEKGGRPLGDRTPNELMGRIS